MMKHEAAENDVKLRVRERDILDQCDTETNISSCLYSISFGCLDHPGSPVYPENFPLSPRYDFSHEGQTSGSAARIENYVSRIYPSHFYRYFSQFVVLAQ